MQIRNRLSLYFTAISTFILVVVQAVICLIFNSLIKSDFYDHLKDRANVAAQLYLEADEITADSLSRVRVRFLERLPDEVIRLYDKKNAASFINDKDKFWDLNTIETVRKRKQLQFSANGRQTVGIYYNDNQGDFVILVSAIDFQGAKRLNDLIESMSILLLCVTAGLFVTSRWFAKKTLEPIGYLIKEMRQVGAGTLSLRVNEGNGKDEISTLAHNFNRLLERLEDAFELQQTFVINASHELRTPITTIIGEIEIALNRTRSHAEYEEVLKSALFEAGRLNETINSLLELAHVDLNFTRPELKPVAVDELIWELSDYWTKKTNKGQFVVNILHLPEDYEKLKIPANKALLTIALNNIIGNAFKFSNNKPVQCGLYADEKYISIQIADSGVGILPQELEKVFHSFFRGSNVNDINGHGIGLYVTQKIIKLFNGSIVINSVPNESTIVTIRFSR
jgi:signal transduction histidine kinase